MHTLSLRLQHLSQEHRAAMLLVAAVREGGTEGIGVTNPANFVDKVRHIFETEMAPHFGEEELYVIPRLHEIGRDDLAEKILAQHAELRRMIAALKEPDADFVEKLSCCLQEHVDFEENTVWAVLDAMSPPFIYNS